MREDAPRLRAAVGDDQLSYVGYSYGTFLGATYANLFPRRIRVLALDANSDPPMYPVGPGNTVPFIRIGAHLAASETLGQFFALCRAAGPDCALDADGDPATVFATLAERLRAEPFVLPDGQRVGYSELVDFTLYQATTPSTMERADAEPAEEPYHNVQEALFASVCGETRNPADPLAYEAIAARADSVAPYVGAFWTYLTLPCAVWPAHDTDRYTGPWSVRTAYPALILNTRYDPATGHRNAVRMTELLAGSRLVTVEGWGHTARDTRSACADAALTAYLVRRVLPPRSVTCQPGVVDDYRQVCRQPAACRHALAASGRPPMTCR